MNVPDGGPAFPVDVEDTGPIGGSYRSGGLSLRDYFAGQVLPAVYAASIARGDELQETIVSEAYEVADAMLTEREKPR